MLLALALTLLTQRYSVSPCGPDGPVMCSAATSLRCSQFNYSLSPPAQACACAADARFTVTSGATYCVKGNEWTGIQPGDFVACPANVLRWMPGGDGTGPIGLQVWEDSSNPLLWPQAFDNVAWSSENNIVPAPVVTANTCLAPDGTMTADMIHFPAVAASALQYSSKFQNACNVAPNFRGLYARTVNPDAGLAADNGGVLTGQFWMDDGKGNLNNLCTHTSSGYVRCREFDVDAGQVNTLFKFGVDGTNGAIAEQYVCVWQADCQANNDYYQNPWPPPIPTTTIAVSRAGDTINANGFYFPQWSNWLLQASMLDESGAGLSHIKTLVEVNQNSGGTQNSLQKLADDLHVQCQFCSATACGVVSSVATSSSASDMLQCTYDGGTAIAACVNGAGCGSIPIDAGSGSETYLTLGSHWNGFVQQQFLNGVLISPFVKESACKDISLFGDSIVEAHTAGPGFEPQYLIHNTLRGDTVNIENHGVSGENSAQCRTRLLSQLGYVIDAGTAPRSYFMIQCGINNIDDAGCVNCGAGVGVLGDLTDALARAQDAGVHALWSTVIPFGSQTANILTVNNAMKPWCAGKGIPIADTYSAMEFPPSSGTLNPAYDYGDHEHPNDAGVWVETNVWVNAGGW